MLSPLLDEVNGQDQAKRALVIAAAGHHNLLFSGSPGTGKTMLERFWLIYYLNYKTRR